jgi:hypothetical protein
MITKTKGQPTLLAATVLLFGSAVTARADYNFTFNSLTPSTADQSVNIQNYMDAVIGCANCVTVTAGVAVAQKYTGDGHVVGPGGVALTLGNTNGATNNSGPLSSPVVYDSYLSNTAADSNGNNPSQLSQQIVITFTHGVSLTGKFSFDYQIFPDGSTNQPPDLIFVANGSTPVNKTFLGVLPSSLSNGTSMHSPISGGSTTEAAAQFIGTYSTTLTGATSLSFVDWPATIGVDNLKLVTPEPRGGVFFLGALALAVIAGTRLRRALAKP